MVDHYSNMMEQNAHNRLLVMVVVQWLEAVYSNRNNVLCHISRNAQCSDSVILLSLRSIPQSAIFNCQVDLLIESKAKQNKSGADREVGEGIGFGAE